MPSDTEYLVGALRLLRKALLSTLTEGERNLATQLVVERRDLFEDPYVQQFPLTHLDLG